MKWSAFGESAQKTGKVVANHVEGKNRIAVVFCKRAA